MRKQNWMVGTAAVLALGAAVGRAQEKPATPEQAPMPRLETPSPQAAAPEPSEMPELSLPAGIHPMAAAPCAACAKHGKGFCQRLWEWATYRPLGRQGICCCLPCCRPCCDPHLYTYFLDTSRHGPYGVVPPPAIHAGPAHYLALTTWEEPLPCGPGPCRPCWPPPHCGPGSCPAPAPAQAAPSPSQADGDSTRTLPSDSAPAASRGPDSSR